MPGPHLHCEQHVQAFEEDRVHMKEIAGQQAISLSTQERPPGGIYAPRVGLHRRARRIRRTVAALMQWPSRRSSPCTLRYPQAGFSHASRSAKARMSWLVRGRPSRSGYVHLRVIRRRCQASSVPG